MGQAHTTKNGYTPSRNELNSLVKLAKKHGIFFMGWYGNNASPTDMKKNFDAIDPNATKGFMFESSYTRWLYAHDLLVEAQEK